MNIVVAVNVVANCINYHLAKDKHLSPHIPCMTLSNFPIQTDIQTYLNQFSEYIQLDAVGHFFAAPRQTVWLAAQKITIKNTMRSQSDPVSGMTYAFVYMRCVFESEWRRHSVSRRAQQKQKQMNEWTAAITVTHWTYYFFTHSRIQAHLAVNRVADRAQRADPIVQNWRIERNGTQAHTQKPAYECSTFKYDAAPSKVFPTL